MTSSLYRAISTLDLTAQALSRDLDRPAVITQDGITLTAGDLRDCISQYRQFFESLEPRPKRAAVLSRNRIEVVYAANGLSFSGVVQTALHPMGAVEDYLYVLADAAIDTLVYDPDHYEDIAADLQRQAPSLRNVFALGAGKVGHNIAEASKAFTPKPLIAPPVEDEAIFRIAYSGGTTGKPKGILCSHRSAATSALLQMTSWEWPKVVRHLICAPLSHAGAAVLTTVLHKNGCMVVLPGFDPVKVMQAIETHRITSVLMVPTMVIAMIDHPRFGEFDLSSLEIIFYGASAFPASRLKDAIGKLGPIFFQFYGQAEAPMSVTVMRRDEHDVNNLQRLASCGRPTPMVHVALLDDDCNEVKNGEPGEICVRGPLVMSGYHNKPEETAAAFQGDWLHTGDIAIKGADDFLRIVDRKKDMIISGGFNIYAREVEDVLVEHPAVRQAAVIGVSDPKWGEAVKAVIVLEPGVTVSVEELVTLVRERKGAVQAPKTIEFVEALPLSPLGKPDKRALRQRFAKP